MGCIEMNATPHLFHEIGESDLAEKNLIGWKLMTNARNNCSGRKALARADQAGPLTGDQNGNPG